MTNLYEVLRRPLITEKSNYLSGKFNQYVFEVADDATKDTGERSHRNDLRCHG